MKIINTGITYRIYDDSLKVFDQLPTKTYQVCFSMQSGFFLEEMDNVDVGERIYGAHQKKADKILDSFKDFDRNLGVILSGDKGIGKSICAKLIARDGLLRNYPVLIVNEYIPGIADYLASIKQEVICIFDEFEKTFKTNAGEHGNLDSQTEMLTLFDGMYGGKKLFIVTCNNLNSLNEYLVNRPGRFHYHLRFDYPASDEIKEYLLDKVPGIKPEEIDKVISFASRINLNYDCLRAITFELKRGEKFETAIRDLNILNTNNANRYNAYAVFEDGTRLKYKNAYVDFFGDNEDSSYVSFKYSEKEGIFFDVRFDADDGVYNSLEGATIIAGDKIECHWTDRDDDELLEDRIPTKAKLSYVMFKKVESKDIHYSMV